MRDGTGEHVAGKQLLDGAERNGYLVHVSTARDIAARDGTCLLGLTAQLAAVATPPAIGVCTTLGNNTAVPCPGCALPRFQHHRLLCLGPLAKGIVAGTIQHSFRTNVLDGASEGSSDQQLTTILANQHLFLRTVLRPSLDEIRPAPTRIGRLAERAQALGAGGELLGGKPRHALGANLRRADSR